MVQATSRGSTCLIAPDGDWTEYPPGAAYRCEIYLSQDGAAFVAAAALPGVVGRGNTEADALGQARQSAAEFIRGCKSAGTGIPWAMRELRPGEKARVLLVQP